MRNSRTSSGERGSRARAKISTRLQLNDKQKESNTVLNSTPGDQTMKANSERKKKTEIKL